MPSNPHLHGSNDTVSDQKRDHEKHGYGNTELFGNHSDSVSLGPSISHIHVSTSILELKDHLASHH